MPFCAERKHTNTNNKRCFTRSSLADRSRLYNIERTQTRTLQFIKKQQQRQPEIHIRIGEKARR